MKRLRRFISLEGLHRPFISLNFTRHGNGGAAAGFYER